MSAHVVGEVVVDHDPSVWLRGPDADVDDRGREQWRLAALEAYAAAWDLRGHDERSTQLRAYLDRLFSTFGDWDPPAQMRFLRVRHPADEPIPAGMEFYDEQQLADIAVQLPGADFVREQLRPPSERPLVGETSLEDVGEAPGWQRLVYSLRTQDDAVVSFVRYVRHFGSSGVLVVLRFGGDTPGKIVETIPDADRLVASVSVEGER